MNVKLEEARISMHEAMELYGISSKEALKASQMLDILVAEEQARRMEEFKLKEKEIIVGGK